MSKNQKLTDQQKFLQLLNDFRISYYINAEDDYSCKSLRENYIPQGTQTYRISVSGSEASSKIWGASCYDSVEFTFDKKNGKYIQMSITSAPSSCVSTYKPKKIVKWKK